MSKRKTTYYLDEEVLTAAKLTAAATHRSESALVEEALRAYLVDEHRAEQAQASLHDLLDRLARRPGADELSDDETMELAVKEVRDVRRARRSRAAG
ncbi:MAG: hypothetical protein M0T79_15130 [Actinomycetota bacterium]|nr:hypothetical protein [Actinomycetota bacterium]